MFEPGEGASSDSLEQFTDVPCPYCGEVILVRLDLSAGSQSYVEDCQVCCQPIQMVLSVAEDGTLDAVLGERTDR
ncbi:MAG: CPXCG motif-containing cysteine-rich protein [Steroidobacteraceae bacterium]